MEQPNNDEPFISAQNIERFGYLADDESYTPGNPDGLPIGFAKEPADNGEDWVGMTCAACHTGEIRYRGRTIRIDGAPTLGDFTAFEQSLIQALQATLGQPDKFDRFAQDGIDRSHRGEPDRATGANVRSPSLAGAV